MFKMYTVTQQCDAMPVYCKGYLTGVFFCRYSRLSLEVVGKQNKCKSFWPAIFSRRDHLNFATADCYRDLPYTVWQSLVEFRFLISVCEAWQWIESRIYLKLVKNKVQFEAVSGTKFMSFWDYVGDPAAHLLDYVYHVSFRIYRPLNCR